MADLIYVADLDTKAVLAALKRIDANIDKMASAADKQFQGVGKSAHASGIQIGLISGVVSSLTTEFINLGKQAVGILVDIAKEGAQTALEFDTLRARLLGIFDGSKPAAEEAFDFIQKKSKELGIDLGELAGAFLPKTESLAQFERVAKIATALARSDPEQGSSGARLALIEGLSGTFTSLQRRFEIPKEDINRIKEAFDTRGMEGFISTLETVLAESGKSFDDLANTAQTSIDKVNIQFEQLKGALGVPIVAELKEQFDALFTALEDDKFTEIATIIGQIVAEVLDFMSSGFVQELSQVDPEGFIKLAESIFELLGNIQMLADTVFNLPDDFSAINTAVEGLTKFVNFINIELRGWSIAIALAKGGVDAIVATAPKLVGIVQALSALGKAAQGNLVAAALEAKEAADNLQSTTLFDPEAGKAALKETLQGISDALKEVDAGSAGSKEKLQALLDSLGEVGQTGAADELLGIAASERELAAAAEAAAEAQAKVDEAFAKAALDNTRKLEDIEITHGRKLLDIQIEFANKRVDAARDNLQKIADLRRKNAQDVEDAGTDLERHEQDIARKFADERIDLERDQRQSRLDIETSFRQKLEDIQSQSAFDLEEAERNRDAVGFLRILRQQQQQVSTAQTDRQRELDELRVNGELKKEELRIQQQREIEEAHITNERKLEDLRLNLDRQIEAQNTAYAQQIEDIAINEARKNEEAAKARERDIEDAKLAYDRKLADLQVSLAEELAIIAAGNAAIEAEAKRHADEMAAIAAQERASAPVRDTGRPSSRPGAQNIQQQYAAQPASRPGAINQGRQFGGLVNAGQTYNVHPPELFTPSSNGKIIPSNQLLMPSMMPKSAISNITNNNQKSANLGGLLDANSLDTLLASKVQNILLQMLDRMG